LHSTASRWLVLFGLLSCAATAAQDAATAAIDACLAELEGPQRKPEAGLKEIVAQCPELKSILEHSPYAAWLPEEWWHQQLTSGSLLELREHIEHESAARAAGTLDTSGVSAALGSLAEDLRASKVTWWDRLREWLRSRLQPEEEEQPTWLFEWLDKLSRHEAALRVAMYTLFGLIVIAAIWIVINELRAAGVFGVRARRAALSAERRAGSRQVRELTLADIENSDPANRPSMLLALLLTAWARREDRAVDNSTTHRELAARIALEDSSQRMAFGRLVRCAERVRYAAVLPSRTEIDEAVSDARSLLDSIDVSSQGVPA
jgi:hypothetical protein